MDVKFIVLPDGASDNIQLMYLRKQYSFYAEGSPVVRDVSIVVNDVELFFDDSGRVLYADGYCPYQRWLDLNQARCPVPATL